MTTQAQRNAAKAFVQHWMTAKGYEKGETQSFWTMLLQTVFGIDTPQAEYILFEHPVRMGHTSFIDAYIPSAKVIIEQKSKDVELTKPAKQSDGSELTPFQQAKRYADELPYSDKPRWIIICNFQTFHVYDMEQPHSPPAVIHLGDLPKEIHRLSFLVDESNVHLKREMKLSIEAGKLVGCIYDAILKHYIDPTADSTFKSLNKLCVRIVFCLYAEDAGLFKRKNQFHDYLSKFSARHLRKALIELFDVLDTPTKDRDPYLDEDLRDFPYVSGGLFAKSQPIEIPQFDEEVRSLILSRASDDFDWSEISPTIFGAVFESTLNPITRRSGGMHYTTPENIHKVIDPLFLDDLRATFNDLLKIESLNARNQALRNFQERLSGLRFLDPACGSGNFLTETYLSLRRLENKVIQVLNDGQGVLGLEDVIKVSISQFYGIEINDFAVSVAQAALWIAESQMMTETVEIVHTNLDFLPLKSYPNILEANALRIDWNTVIPKEKLNYIMGNPPFVGFTYMSAPQKEDMQRLFPKTKNLDFVTGWYKVASDYIQGTNIECGFVSTNSITQGETVASLWKHLNIKINYAHTTFIWESEASLKAHVHCVIIGFAAFDREQKMLYTDGEMHLASNINAYLIDAPNIIVTSRTKPLQNVPSMIYGNKPADGGNLIIEENDYDAFVKEAPQAMKYIKPLLGAVEYLHNKKRWCLWLEGVSPSEIRSIPALYQRVLCCKQVREKSVAAAIRKFAETPALFAQRTQPVGKPFVIVPRVSSENRRYVPMGFMDGNTIVSDAVQIIPEATRYHFGVLTSSVHMGWMRAVCGRLEMRYRYSKDVVYNNFPWPEVTPEQQAEIEQTAQAILDARALYPDCSLADLYDEVTMPIELRKAHQANDKAIMKAYGYAPTMTEPEIVADLMRRYLSLTQKA